MSDQRHNVQELNQLFSDGETGDQELFAEQRSNVQLISGEHYSKKGHHFWNRLRENKEVSQDQKIRLTKNHIRKIVLIYTNAITTYAPGVQASPKDKSSLQHQKSAELKNAVWADGKNRHDFNQLINQLAADFCGIGECALKLWFNPMAGKFLGMEASMKDGQVELDEMGQPVASDNPKFAGDVIAERIFSFNIIRQAGAKNLKDSEFLCHRKMVKIDDARAMVDASTKSDEEKEELKKKIMETPDGTYMVLDGNTGKYNYAKDQCMLKEWFFRPCAKYPKGYFYIQTGESILFEGELPFGIFPILMEGFDSTPTSPRCRSIVKVTRPYQVEINRCASKMAEHQITLGDDKILVQNGSKLTPGVTLPGVRSFQYSGMQPIVMEGRTGAQYLEYMNAQISEMYSVAMVEDMLEEKQEKFDPYQSLFRSIKDKKKFSFYSDKFESFLKSFYATYITLCQNYYDENHLIPAIGKSEYINIAEFKGTDELSTTVILEPQSDDSETKLGRQIALNHFIQYVGPQLGKDDLGKILRLMPYANDEEILEDLTMDYDCSVNYMLAMDRGEQVEPKPEDNHPYLIKKFINRTRQPDFKLLPPESQMLYKNAIAQHQQMQTDNEVKIKQAQSEFIPTSGYLVACDFYVPDPKNPEKLPKRVRLPSEALGWLIKQLESQGSSQETLQNLGQGALADMSSMLMQKLQQAGLANQGQGMPPGQMPSPGLQMPPMQQMGPTSPRGV